MKRFVKIGNSTSEMIALCYQNMQSAQEYARAITIEPGGNYSVQDDFRSVAASLAIPIDRIDRRIPKSLWQMFLSQIKDNDKLRLDNINSLFTRMLPDQQAMLELAAEGILRRDIEITA